MALPENAYAAQVTPGMNEDKAPAIMAEIARQFDTQDNAYGKVCVLEAGSYRLDTPIVIDVNTQFRGIDPRSGFTGTVLRPKSSRVFTFDGNVAGSGGWTFNSEIADLLIWPEESTTRPSELVYFDKQYSNRVRNVKVSASGHSTPLCDYVAHVESGNHLVFDDCRLVGADGSSPEGAGLLIEGGSVHLADTDIEGNKWGVDFRGGYLSVDPGCYFENNPHGHFRINNNGSGSAAGALSIHGGLYKLSSGYKFMTFDLGDGDPAGNGGGNIAMFYPTIEGAGEAVFDVYSLASTEVADVFWYGPEPPYDLTNTSEVSARERISFNGGPA